MAAQQYVSEELTHFVGRHEPDDERRFRLLVQILRERHLAASRLQTSGTMHVDMLSDSSRLLSTSDAIRCRMLCFCDIPPGQFEIHMQKYSRFGVAFRKRDLVPRGVTPVHYIPTEAMAPSLGPQSRLVADQFDELRQELHKLETDLTSYVTEREGPLAFHFKLSPPGTPPGHQILGRLGAAVSELEQIVFARTKFFQSGLSEDDHQNYYMEREWRKFGSLSFRHEEVARVIMPRAFEQRFRCELALHAGVIHPVDDAAEAVG